MVNPFGRMCRTCMCKEQNFHSLLENANSPLHIYEMLATTMPQLFIQTGGVYPDLICTICLNKLNIAYHFQQMCLASDKQMRTMLGKSEKKLNEDVELEPEADPLNGHELLEQCIKMEDTVASIEVTNIDLIDTLQHDNMDESKKSSLDAEEASGNVSDVLSDNDEGIKNKATKCKGRRKITIKLSRGKRKTKKCTTQLKNKIEKPKSVHRGKEHFPCTECGKDFDRAYRLDRHIGVHDKDRPLECELCHYRFNTANHLAFHKRTACATLQANNEAPTEGFQCSDCPRRFEKRESLAAHIQSHRRTSEQAFECEVCHKSFTKFTNLARHARYHKFNERHKCHLCAQTFGASAELDEHLRKQHNGAKQAYPCMNCEKSFQHSSALKEHMRVHTGEMPYLCSECGKAFNSGSNMRQHMMRHSSEKRYECMECPKRFTTQSDVNKHMSTHRGVKPHICDICGSSFTRSYSLKKHKYIHTGERPFKCEECSMTFVFVHHMRRHLRTHTGEKPYKCTFCDRAYSESGDLNKHLRKHIGEKTYQCTECKSAFKYQVELRDHEREHYLAAKAKQSADVKLTAATAEVEANPKQDSVKT